MPPTPVHADHRPASPTTDPFDMPLDARLAAVEAAMTVRLETASARLAVDAAEADRVVLLEEVVTGPVAAPEPADGLYGSPVAGAFQRSARRLRTGGWCRGASVDADGARCLYGVLHATTGGGRVERDALDVLEEAIRRRWPHLAEATVPAVNDHQLRDGDEAARLLDDAARIADARGL